MAIAQLGYFMQHTTGLFHETGLFRHAGFESRTVAIAQLGYFMAAAHNWAISSCWVRVSHGGMAQLGYFMQHTTGLFHAAHNWVISSCWAILSCWVRISHGGHSTTGLFHAAHNWVISQTVLFCHAGSNNWACHAGLFYVWVCSIKQHTNNPRRQRPPPLRLNEAKGWPSTAYVCLYLTSSGIIPY